MIGNGEFGIGVSVINFSAIFVSFKRNRPPLIIHQKLDINKELYSFDFTFSAIILFECFVNFIKQVISEKFTPRIVKISV